MLYAWKSATRKKTAKNSMLLNNQWITEEIKEEIKKYLEAGVPVVVQWLTNPTRNHEVAGSVPALAQWVSDPALPRAVV